MPECPPHDPQHLNDYLIQELTTNVRGLRSDIAELKGLRQDIAEVKEMSQKTFDRIFVTNGQPSLVDELRDIKTNGSQPLREHVAEHRKIERKLLGWLLGAVATGGVTAAGVMQFLSGKP